MKGTVRSYFPGGNTPEGFVSYYGDILSQGEANRIFCIKGGPGTGKSTLMKKIGEYYINRGFDTELLKCSSDPHSLDGIVIREKKIAIIDGTKPHITDPENPGAVDEIIDLGEFFDKKKLILDRDKIISLNKKISETFGYAYCYLKCADILMKKANSISNEYVDNGNVLDLALSLEMTNKGKRFRCKDSNLANGVGFSARKRRCFGSGLTSAGAVSELCSITEGIKDIYLIDLPGGYRLSGIMNIISRRLLANGFSTEELYCPMAPFGEPEHIISRDAGIAVFTCNEFHDSEMFNGIKIREKIDADYNSPDFHDENKIEELLDGGKKHIDKALKVLSVAKQQHDELEKYYIEAMDFKKLDKVEAETISKIDKLIG